MSLVERLRSRRGPVFEFMSRRLPHTRALATEANRALHGLLGGPALPRPPGANAGAVGTALELWLRLRLAQDRALTATAPFSASALDAAHGRCHPDHPGRGPVQDEVRDVDRRLRALTVPARRRPPAWALRGLLLLAHMEHCARAARALLALQPLAREAAARGQPLAGLLISPQDLRDLRALIVMTGPWARELRRAHHIAASASFDLSRDLGGADCDLVADGRLAEVKTTTQACIVERMCLWQLAGYLLADQSDRYAIRRLEVWAPRWGARLAWPAEALLSRLSGEDAVSLPAWRAAFAAAVSVPAPGPAA